MDDAAALAQRMNRQQRAEASLNHPEIKLPDMFGTEHKLSDLNGKVVLLYFWSITDTNTSGMNNEMKALYKDYKDKGFEIYQVALNDDKANWVMSVQTQKLPWINVIDLAGFTGLTAMSYNVAATPVNILLDREGNIVDRNLRGEQLRTRINGLL